MTWVIISMSGYWVINRLLHGVGGTAGETERDGVIWLLPLATGWIPCIAILLFKIHIYQAVAVFIWSFIPTALIMFIRPEINHDAFKPKHLERSGLSSSLRSLFKYRIDVCEPRDDSSSQSIPTIATEPRFSVSCFIYYMGFSITGSLIIIVRPILDSMAPSQVTKVSTTWLTLVGAGIFALLAAFVAGLALTYGEKQIGWKIQEKERQILAILYFLSTVNIIAVLMLSFVLPILKKMT